MAENQAQTKFEFDNNALVQAYPGLVSKIHSGFVFAARSLTGKVVVYKNSFPIVGRLPFTEGKFINISRLSREVVYPDGVKISDDITLTCSSPIRFHIHVDDTPESISRVFNEVNADNNTKELVKKIVDLVVNNMPADKVRHKFSISYYNLESLIDNPGVIEEVRGIFHEIHRRYGILIEEIMDIDFNEPDEIIQALHARQAKSIENQQNEEYAESQLRVAQLNSQSKFIESVTNFEALNYAIQVFGWTNEQVLEYIKADILRNNPNMTVIANLGGVDNVAAMALNYYSRYAGHAGISTGNDTYASNVPGDSAENDVYASATPGDDDDFQIVPNGGMSR